jgi:hypothetical protein
MTSSEGVRRPFVDAYGRRHSWGELTRKVRRHVHRKYPKVGGELRADAVQAGMASLLASLGREWFHAAKPGNALHFERCVLHASARARRHIGRQVAQLAHEAPVVDVSDEPIPDTELPEYLAGNEDLYRRIRMWFAELPNRAEFEPLLIAPSELAAELGISERAACGRQAVLKRRLHALAVAAGFLGGTDGFYDHER